MARVFGRRLAVVILAASVLGNGVAHLLEAYHLEAAWWLVVAVSALAPCVLDAVVHLVVLAVQDDVGTTDTLDAPERFPAAGTVRGTHDPSTPAPASRAVQVGEFFPDPGETLVGQLAGGDNLDRCEDGSGPTVGQEPTDDRAAELIAEGAGRRRLAKELGISEYKARQLISGRVNGNGAVS